MANLEGMKSKFCVIKNADIANLNPESREKLHEVLQEIAASRHSEGKPVYHYVVINTDEPYADEIIEIMKRHGHWG